MSNIPYLWPWSNCFKGEKLLIITVRRFQDDVCPLSFVPLLCCLQWHIKPLLRQISDETASTNKKNIYIYIYCWTSCDKRLYKWINFGTPQEAFVVLQQFLSPLFPPLLQLRLWQLLRFGVSSGLMLKSGVKREINYNLMWWKNPHYLHRAFTIRLSKAKKSNFSIHSTPKKKPLQQRCYFYKEILMFVVVIFYYYFNKLFILFWMKR